MLLGMATGGVCAAPWVPGAAHTPYGQRARFIHKLLEESSAAKRVEASKNPQVKALHEQARKVYQKALGFYRAGDTKAGDAALQRATDTMFKAVRLAKRRQVIAGGQRYDFKMRLESVDALLKAYERITKQKGVQAKLRHAVQARVAEAKALLKQGQLAKARKILDEAYVAVKTAVKVLRNGETLVHSLHFATKKDEYHYEVDRNRTYRMLIRMLMADRTEDDRVRKGVRVLVDKANAFRVTAEKQAASGDYAGAIRSLEESTHELARAIRNAGLFIPG
jgi:tetratricopeptide (TPR) repeat protein